MTTATKPRIRVLPRPRRLAIAGELDWFSRHARAPRIRTLRDFAESEIVVPEGRYEGQKFRCSTLPWTGLLYDAIDSGTWRRIVVTGCVQGGKTLCAYVVPIMYHLFEWRERTIVGVPDLKTGHDKLTKELLPVIRAQPKFARYLPTTGRGSQGGWSESLQMGNSAELRLMHGGGGDENRSNVTSRVAACTEADRLDDISESSREASPIFQIEARTFSYEQLARFYAECTTTFETGFVHRERKAGTDSRIACQCVSCGEFVTPEREDLVGWEDAENELQAAEMGAFCCRECGVIWSDEDRIAMNRHAVLLHRGQSIDRDGNIEGKLPQTVTLGFRFAAFNNLLWSSGYIAQQAWAAKNSRDPESAERQQRQWFFVEPLEPDEFAVTPLEAAEVLGRQAEGSPPRILPIGTQYVSAGVDCRKSQLHFTAIAWTDRGGQLVDCGIRPVDYKQFGLQKALRLALRELAEYLNRGWPLADDLAKRFAPGWCAIDAGYLPDLVRGVVREQIAQIGKRYLPSFGRGISVSQQRGRQYQHPDKTTREKPHIGEQFYVSWSMKHALHAVFVNADHWKSQVHEMLSTPLDQPGALTLFDAETEADQKTLRQLARQATSETAVEAIQPGKGMVTKWDNPTGRPNHYLDCLYLAAAMGHLCGYRALEGTTAPPARRTESWDTGLRTPDGRPYFASER